MSMNTPLTLFDKVWAAHEIVQREDGEALLWVDRHFVHEGSFNAFGIGASEVAHVLMTQTLWQRKPKRMRITVHGRLSSGIAAKDIVLAIIAKIGADGATGHAIEFSGPVIRALSMEGRLTLCNM